MSNKRWMRPEERAVEAPFFAVFRNRFHAGSGAVLKFRYSADERAAFFLDGEKIADGPERGTPQRWFFHSVEVPLAPGAHVLTCRLLVLGGQYSAYAQLSVRPGVCVDEESDLLGDWACQTMMGCTFARAGGRLGIDLLLNDVNATGTRANSTFSSLGRTTNTSPQEWPTALLIP